MNSGIPPFKHTENLPKIHTNLAFLAQQPLSVLMHRHIHRLVQHLRRRRLLVLGVVPTVHLAPAVAAGHAEGSGLAVAVLGIAEVARAEPGAGGHRTVEALRR